MKRSEYMKQYWRGYRRVKQVVEENGFDYAVGLFCYASPSHPYSKGMERALKYYRERIYK